MNTAPFLSQRKLSPRHIFLKFFYAICVMQPIIVQMLKTSRKPAFLLFIRASSCSNWWLWKTRGANAHGWWSWLLWRIFGTSCSFTLCLCFALSSGKRLSFTVLILLRDQSLFVAFGGGGKSLLIFLAGVGDHMIFRKKQSGGISHRQQIISANEGDHKNSTDPAFLQSPISPPFPPPP